MMATMMGIIEIRRKSIILILIEQNAYINKKHGKKNKF